MTRREIFQNSTSDTLSATCASGDTTISVTTGSKWPASGDFHVLIDSEIMLVTGRSANTLTVVRGQEGTTAAAHSLSAVITLILTAGSVRAYHRDNVPGFDGAKPPYRLTDSSGNPLTSSNFSVINLNTSTVSDQDGGIVLRMVGNAGLGDSICALARAKTNPSTLIVGLRFALPRSTTSSYPLALAGFRESGTGKLMFQHVVNQGSPQYQAAKYTSPTVQSSLIVAANSLALSGDVTWFRCVDDGTLLTLSLSHDGQTWLVLFSEARTAFMAGGPDQFIWGGDNNGNGFDIATTLVSWSEG